MLFYSQRIMETEAMETLEEVRAYDLLTLKYLTILHNGFVETILNLASTNGRFLEVGCGTGRISIGVAKYSANISITGVDLSENMLTVAQENATSEGVQEKITFQLGDAKELPFEANFFDAVYCHNMLHHVPDPLSMLKEMNRVAKTEGALLIRDLIRVSPFLIPFHVHLLGLPYNKLMKKEYRDSIKASLSKKEWRELSYKSGIKNAHILKYFITHQGIERPAEGIKDRAIIHIPTPLFISPLKNLYVSPLIKKRGGGK